MYTIYILRCEQKKYYIGKTKKLTTRLEDHFNKSGAEWTKIYKPVEVIELHPNCDSFDEDKYTLQFMEKYGIENVRGGTFTKFKLDLTDITAINKMIRGATDKCHKCGSSEHFISECPNKPKIVDNYTDSLQTITHTPVQSVPVNNQNSFTSVLSNIWSTITSLAMPVSTFEENDICYRFGREGHYAKECYAIAHVKGYLLNNVCYRCGRKGHYVKECYAKTDVNGKYI